jgi:hypothetical protein
LTLKFERDPIHGSAQNTKLSTQCEENSATITEGQSEQRLYFGHQVWIERHLHRQPAAWIQPYATVLKEGHALRELDPLNCFPIFDQTAGSTAKALVFPVFALKKAP